MSNVYCMITITGKNQGERFSSLFKTEQLPVMLLTLGAGTASSEMLDYFGMESREKIVIFTVVTQESWRRVKRQMEEKLNIDVPGTASLSSSRSAAWAEERRSAIFSPGRHI